MLPSSVEVKRRAHRNVHNPLYRRSWPLAPPHGNRNPKVCMIIMSTIVLTWIFRFLFFWCLLFLLLLCLLVYIRDACELLFIKTLSELIEVRLTLNRCFMNEAVRCNDTECCSWYIHYIEYKINGHFCIVLEYSTSYIQMLLICEWGKLILILLEIPVLLWSESKWLGGIETDITNTRIIQPGSEVIHVFLGS